MTKQYKMRTRGQLISRGVDADGYHRWLLRIYTGTGSDGKKRYTSRTIKATVQEAQKAITKMLTDHAEQRLIPRSAQTLAAYLQEWEVGKIDVAPRTRIDYNRQLRYVTEAIGTVKLSDVTPRHVQGVVLAMVSRGLSPRTVEYCVRVLHAAFSDAVKHRLLPHNPADHITLPKKVKRPPSVLTVEQVNHLFNVTKDDPLSVVWRLLLTTGLRPQEALALRWSDLDLKGNWLSVQRVLAGDGHGVYSIVEATKTEGSTRRIGLPIDTTAALKTHKKRQEAQQLVAGKKYEDTGLVFTNAVGHPVDPNWIRRCFKATLKTAKLPDIRLYDCRHTAFTMLLAAGADIALIASLAGHKDIKMTASTYAHVMPASHQALGELTQKLLSKKKKRTK